MSFVVRIFFMGMMAFVPTRDGKELTVLLVDAGKGYVASDGSSIEPHIPLLLARAGGCVGPCDAGNTAIGQLLFPGTGDERVRDGLSKALLDGAAWRLDGADLSFHQPCAAQQAEAASLVIHHKLRDAARSGQPALLPRSSDERKDFSWVAELGRIAPSAGVVDPDTLTAQPKKGLIVARLRLQAGEVWTYRLVSVGDRVLPLEFYPLSGDGPKSSYSQALADWMMAELRVSGGAMELVETRFDGRPGRMVSLAPKEGVVELALMNVPEHLFEQPSQKDASHSSHEPGVHFEMYYELARTKLPNRLRPVPHLADSSGISWSAVHQGGEAHSPLLNALRLNDGRGVYNRIICPVAQLSEGGSE